ncbi:hypothetical protein MVEN_01289000 [Mycena venus]|uniref:Uncharacterized protein n=1 Tax=Mycena venus TaxID=2733690 RepID=A0A8H7CTK3_9AGAR|nr:hypothetical protein MVEN_01289000 [Mycena venus]
MPDPWVRSTRPTRSGIVTRGIEGVDAVNCNWSRNVDVDVANKKWHCDEGVEGVDAVNCNWSRNVDVDVANKKWHCDEAAEGVDAVNCNWT